MNAFHVTIKRLVPLILARGLQPRIGPRAKELGESEKAIYMYKTKKDCKQALEGWFGECFFGEDVENLVILEVALGKNVSAKTDGDEICVLDLIDPSTIKKILATDLKQDLTDQFEAVDLTQRPEPPKKDTGDDDFFSSLFKSK